MDEPTAPVTGSPGPDANAAIRQDGPLGEAANTLGGEASASALYPLDESTSGDEKSKKKQRLIGLVAGVALVVGLGGVGAAVVANQSQPVAEAPTNTPIESSPPTEAPAASPEAPAPNVFERTPIPAELAKYKEMSLDNFKNLPKTEQWAYVSWLDQYRPAFETRFALVTGNPEDKPVTITPNSSGADLYLDYVTSLRLATSFTPDGTYLPSSDLKIFGISDKDSVEKLVLAAHSEPAAQDSDVSATTNQIETMGHAVNVDTQALNHFFAATDIKIVSEVKMTSKNDKGEDIVTTIVTYTAVDGTTYKIPLTATKITAFDGTTQYRATAGIRTQV